MAAIKSSEDLYLNRAKFVMKLLGVWLPPEKETIVHKIYRFFMVFLQYLFLIFQMIYIVQVWGDLEAVSQASYLLFTQACLCFKVTVFLTTTDKLRDLLGRMNCATFEPQSATHEKMPVNPKLSPQYELGFAFQLLTICMSAYMYFGVDTVALSMVIFGCAQVDIVKDKIMTIKPVFKENGEREENSNEILSENYGKLIECVIHHQSITSFTELVEDTYHTYLFFQLSGSVGLFCMSALRILVVDWQSMQFFSILMYVSAMFIQIYICCWSGHELTATSEDLHTSMYKCAWYEQDVKFKRAFRFVMMRMSRPMVLRAGHYISLSRQTFVAILRMSYSYFAVLNQTK